MKKGELYWVELPELDGDEQSGRRPALVVQDEFYAGGLQTVIAVFVTGQPANIRFPGAVSVSPSLANGLLKPSVILTHQIRALDRRRFGKRIGVLDPATLAAIYDALDRLTGRPAIVTAPPADPA